MISYHEDRFGPDYEGLILAVLKRNNLQRPPEKDEIAGEIAVYINHGRWIAECPSCHGALDASRSMLLFYCTDCGNQWNGNKWLRVKFPRNYKAIASELVKRPRVENQNWSPGESLQKLRQENAEMGVS